MKRLFLLFSIIPAFAVATPFDLLLNQRNVADTSTFVRQVASPGIGYTAVLLTDSFSGLPVLYKLNNSFYIDPTNKTLDSASDWAMVTNKPNFSSVATSGNYNDLINKPSTSQVNSDWSATSGAAEILNKPALASVATSGAYSDLAGLPSLFNGAYGSLTGIPSTFAPSAHTQAFSTIASTPTTLSGYGITDGVTSATLASYATTVSVTAGLATKFNSPTGNNTQYLRGDGSLSTFPAFNSGTVTSVTAGTGLSGGAITSSGTISMPPVGTAGSYSGVTTDTQGRVSSGTVRIQSAATRTLNTAFQVSTTRDALVNYSVQCTITASIAGGQSCDVILEIATDAAFTAGVQTIGIIGTGQTYTLAIAIQGVQPQTAQVTGYVPAGYYARLRTVNVSGSPTYAYRAGQEILQ